MMTLKAMRRTMRTMILLTEFLFDDPTLTVQRKMLE
jgi:hypothetical protein